MPELDKEQAHEMLHILRESAKKKHPYVPTTTKVPELVEFQQELTKLREQIDTAPILERLDRIETLLVKILAHVDLTEEEQEVLDMLKLELSNK